MTIHDQLSIIHTRLFDGLERNELPINFSPYKTRHELAARNAEHYESLIRQVAALMIEVGKALPM